MKKKIYLQNAMNQCSSLSENPFPFFYSATRTKIENGKFNITKNVFLFIIMNHGENFDLCQISMDECVREK